MITLYGHRGAKGEAPENTLSGFLYAYRAGVRAFELDVRLTADEEIVILHDATVDRTTDGTGRVADLTRGQLAELDARGAFPDWPEPCRIPTFAEFVTVLPTDVRLEIEIKRDEHARMGCLADKLIPLLAEYGLHDRITLSSFEPEALRILKRRAPDLPRAYIGAYDTPAFLETALELECRQADIPLTTGSHEMVRAARANGLRVTGWPGNTQEQLETLVTWGVDGITSDFPSLALPFLAGRGF